jgi:hypothetical protein
MLEKLVKQRWENITLADFDLVLAPPSQSFHYLPRGISILSTINGRIKDILINYRIILMAERLLRLECRSAGRHCGNWLCKLGLAENSIPRINTVAKTAIERMKRLINWIEIYVRESDDKGFTSWL